MAVLYSDEAVGCLASAVQQLLVPGGVLVLADPAGAVAGVEVQLTALFSPRAAVFYYRLALFAPSAIGFADFLFVSAQLPHGSNLVASSLWRSCVWAQDKVRGRAMETSVAVECRGSTPRSFA